MKELILAITLLLSYQANSDNLFDEIKFNECGIGHKTNIPVTYLSIGRGGDYFNNLTPRIETTTALCFAYNDEEYYIDIEEKNSPAFLTNLKVGETIYIDIVVFNTTDCYPRRQKKYYCSYINKIQKKSS